jgi:hypothetical protein
MHTELWFGLMLAFVAAARWLDCAESEPANFESDSSEEPMNEKHE